MAFDIASAQPVGFDLASAQPVTDSTVSTPKASLLDSVLRQIALGGRNVGEAVFDTFAAPHDLGIGLQNLMRAGANKVFGTDLKPQPTFAQNFSDALTNSGAPVPKTTGEQYASAIERGIAGALTDGGALGAASPALATPANLTRAGIAGATGATASEATKQAGGGPGLQFVAGVLGGLSPAGIEGFTRAGSTYLGRAVQPLTRSGQEQIAANLLARQATDPQAAAANLATAQDIVPGSARTTGEASGDAGLLALEKGIRAQNPGLFGQRISEQNVARQGELTALGGTPADIAAAEEARDLETAPMRDQAFDAATQARTLTDEVQDRLQAKASALQTKGIFDTLRSQSGAAAEEPYAAVGGLPRVPSRFSPFDARAAEASSASADMPAIIAQRQAELAGAQSRLAALGTTGNADTSAVHDTIDRLLSSPSGARESVSRTLNWARSLIGDETDPARLYEARKDLQLAQQGKLQPSSADAPNASTLAQSRSQLGRVVESLDNAIESAAPGFKAYLSRYRALSQPIDQMKAIQDIQNRATLSSLDITTGHSFLGAGQFDRALDAAIENPGMKLTPDQLQRLEAVRTDLKYGAALNSPLIRAPGSDTYQNLSLAQVLGAGATDPHPAVRLLARPLSWVYRAAGSDDRMNGILSRAMLDPKMAHQLLQRATPASAKALSDRLRSVLTPYGIGTATGADSTLQSSR